MTDRDLLKAYADSSDAESLDAFVRRYEEPLMRFTARFLGDGEAAQDVVQETFLQVARHPRRLLTVENCHNWLLRVARNLGITRLRQVARFRKHTQVLADRLAQSAQDRCHEASRALEQEETRRKVRAEIEKLGPRHREVLLLKIQEEKSYKEISEITGLTVTNVGYLLHTAMKDLARRLNHSREDLS